MVENDGYTTTQPPTTQGVLFEGALGRCVVVKLVVDAERTAALALA
jgi:hypothetical protein